MATVPRQPDEWSGNEYAMHSGHHRAFDDWFLERHPPSRTDVVVDLGCGSGEFSATVATLVPDGHVIGVDPDTSMLEQARARERPNLSFVEAVHRVLRPGGWYHSESAGSGNLEALGEVVEEIAGAHGIPAPPRFPDVGAVFELLEAAGFEMPKEAVRAVAQRRSFSRDRLTTFLRSQAAVALTRNAPEELKPVLVDDLVAAAERLRRHDGSFDQTFVRLEILVRTSM